MAKAHEMQMPTKEDLLKLLKRCKSVESKLAEEKGNLGEIIATAVEDKNLHKQAFSLVRRWSRKDPAAIYAFLEHFDSYREHIALDDLAGQSLEDAAEEAEAEKPKRGRPAKPKAETAPGGGTVTRLAERRVAAAE